MSVTITISIGIVRSLKTRCESKIVIDNPFFVTIGTLMISLELIPNNRSLPGDRYLNLGSKSDYALS